ncbi:hypothetical protein DdX_08029 [Ditylenchus destructor]|uniref:Uncharacterized protein n=1 Tax=Ditylenchus destructor TaxID=166010 RepID=A0AAD4R7U5_9BILA|nr:hypothetical protein DdX_08029 [Ditylenchus destructor]
MAIETTSDQSQLYFASANENLLERLRLAVQNSEVLSPSQNAPVGPVVQATTILLGKQVVGGGPTTHFRPSTDGRMQWLVLVAKEWESDVLECLADIYRLSMAENFIKSANLLVVKKDASVSDSDFLIGYLDSVKTHWISEWGSNLEKYKRLGDSNARTEHLQKLEQWAKPQCKVTCSVIHIDDQELPQKMADFFLLQNGIEILDSTPEDKSNLFTKPPALHWTHFPREAEMQISFKFNFPPGTVSDHKFRHWTSIAKDSLPHWEYEYEWINGILLRNELVKVTVVRTLPHVIEVSGRIDKDEAAEEEDDENENESNKTENGDKKQLPLSRVWPYFARVLHAFINHINRNKTLPYNLNLIFIGEAFFSCPPGARKINSRSLDAIQTLSAIQRIQSVRFKVDQEHIHSLDLEQSFPGTFKPTQLADFSPDNYPLPEPPRRESSSSSLNTHDIENHTRPSAVSLDTKQQFNNFHVSRDDGDLKVSPHSLHVERQLSGQRNRGRRVSFGAIRAIPTLDGNLSNSSAGNTSPLVMGLTNHHPKFGDDSDQDEGMPQNVSPGNDEVQSTTVVDYVDNLLQKTIDEVLIRD